MKLNSSKEIISKHIYHNFEALCTGGQTKTMTAEELKALAKEQYGNHPNT